MTIGENIKRIRKQKGMTQKELAEKANLNEVTIRSYEAGKYEPKFCTLLKLGKILEVDIDQIDERCSETQVAFQHRDEAHEEEIDDKYAGSIGKIYVSDKVLLKEFHALNFLGKAEAIKRVSELKFINDYVGPRDDVPFD